MKQKYRASIKYIFLILCSAIFSKAFAKEILPIPFDSPDLIKSETNYKYDDATKTVYEIFDDGHETVEQYDEKGNLVYAKYSSGETWSQFNENGNLVYEKDEYGNETYYEYNEDGLICHEYTSNGYDAVYEYNEKNLLVHKVLNYKTGEIGFAREEFYEYDKNNRLIHYLDAGFSEYWNDYDYEKNTMVHRTADGIEYEVQFDSNMNVINYKTKAGEYSISYYENGSKKKEVITKNNMIYTIEYSENNRIIHITMVSNGLNFESWEFFNESGNMIFSTEEYGDSKMNTWIIYEYGENGKLAKKTRYEQTVELKGVSKNCDL